MNADAARPRYSTQAAWSIASSGAAFAATLAPTWGVAVSAGTAATAAVVYGLWIGTIASTIASFGLPTVLGPLAAAALSEPGKGRLPRTLAVWCYAHVLVSGLIGWLLGWLGPGPLNGMRWAPASIALITAATAAQSSGNSLFGGALRNDRVFAMNFGVAVAFGGLLVFVDVDRADSALLLVAIGMAIRLPLMAFLLPGLVDSSSMSRLGTRSWWPAYAISLVGVIGFQRLEAGFLESRAQATDLAAYGLAFDASQVVRGTATSAFAVLVPVFVIELRRRREHTLRMAASLSVMTAAVVAAAALLVTLLGTVFGVSDRLLGGVRVGAVAGILTSTAASAGANVLAQLLLAERRFARYLAVLGASAAAGLLFNALFTRSAVSASAAQLMVAAVFVVATAAATSKPFAETLPWHTALSLIAIMVLATLPTLILSALMGQLVASLVAIAGIAGLSAGELRCLLEGRTSRRGAAAPSVES